MEKERKGKVQQFVLRAPKTPSALTRAKNWSGKERIPSANNKPVGELIAPRLSILGSRRARNMPFRNGDISSSEVKKRGRWRQEGDSSKSKKPNQ